MVMSTRSVNNGKEKNPCKRALINWALINELFYKRHFEEKEQSGREDFPKTYLLIKAWRPRKTMFPTLPLVYDAHLFYQ